MSKTVGLIDMEKATQEELLMEFEECEKLWSLYSCDCFGFYIAALGKKIEERGGWPVRTSGN